MSASKLTRVSFEYADGSIDELTGKDVEDWLKAVNACITMSAIHGLPMRAEIVNRIRRIKAPNTETKDET